jgi:hypothetical protein
LLSQDPLPNIDQAYQRVVHDERLLRGESLNHVNRNNVMAFRVTPDARGKSKFVDNYDKLCNHCNREKGTTRTRVFKFMVPRMVGGSSPGWTWVCSWRSNTRERNKPFCTKKKHDMLLYKKNDMFKGPTQKPMGLAHDGP